MHPIVIVEHAALFLIGAFFVWGGLNHFRIFDDLRAMVAARGWPMPAFIVAVGSGWEAGWGLVLASGSHTLAAALALFAFVALSSVTLMDFWSQQGEAREEALGRFMTSLALIGALLLAATLA